MRAAAVWCWWSWRWSIIGALVVVRLGGRVRSGVPRQVGVRLRRRPGLDALKCFHHQHRKGTEGQEDRDTREGEGRPHGAASPVRPCGKPLFRKLPRLRLAWQRLSQEMVSAVGGGALDGLEFYSDQIRRPSKDIGRSDAYFAQ